MVRVGPVLAQIRKGVSPVPAQMWSESTLVRRRAATDGLRIIESRKIRWISRLAFLIWDSAGFSAWCSTTAFAGFLPSIDFSST